MAESQLDVSRQLGSGPVELRAGLFQDVISSETKEKFILASGIVGFVKMIGWGGRKP